MEARVRGAIVVVEKKTMLHTSLACVREASSSSSNHRSTKEWSIQDSHWKQLQLAFSRQAQVQEVRNTKTSLWSVCSPHWIPFQTSTFQHTLDKQTMVSERATYTIHIEFQRRDIRRWHEATRKSNMPMFVNGKKPHHMKGYWTSDQLTLRVCVWSVRVSSIHSIKAPDISGSLRSRTPQLGILASPRFYQS
jgi:hypothetical protein